MTRRNLHIPDDLYREVLVAAARQQQATGQRISAAEWIREAVRQRLAGGERVTVTTEYVEGLLAEIRALRTSSRRTPKPPS